MIIVKTARSNGLLDGIKEENNRTKRRSVEQKDNVLLDTKSMNKENSFRIYLEDNSIVQQGIDRQWWLVVAKAILRGNSDVGWRLCQHHSS